MIFNTNNHVQALSLSYAGRATSKQITVGSDQYQLYTFISSGILTVKGNGTAGVWLCGGGSKGETYNGGGGGYFSQTASCA